LNLLNNKRYPSIRRSRNSSLDNEIKLISTCYDIGRK
jgi:hypothetical protein